MATFAVSNIGSVTAATTPVVTQYAALCYRIHDGKPQILLITSRGSNRWILPKGWPIKGKTGAECALIEAWEEAGVQGKVQGKPIGMFFYIKILDSDALQPCMAEVYPLKVKALAHKFPEKGQRRLKWFSPKKAARKVNEPELAELIRTFTPRKG